MKTATWKVGDVLENTWRIVNQRWVDAHRCTYWDLVCVACGHEKPFRSGYKLPACVCRGLVGTDVGDFKVKSVLPRDGNRHPRLKLACRKCSRARIVRASDLRPLTCRCPTTPSAVSVPRDLSDHQVFVDALREALRLSPLYSQEPRTDEARFGRRTYAERLEDGWKRAVL